LVGEDHKQLLAREALQLFFLNLRLALRSFLCWLPSVYLCSVPGRKEAP